MKDKKVIVYVSLAVLSALLICCSPKLVYKSLWQSIPVTVDGKAKEWSIPLHIYDTKTKLNYSVSNDAQNLYICLRATDDQVEKGIMRYGLQLWIDTTGKKNQQVGIQFPMVQRMDASEQGSGQKRHGGDDNGGQGQQYTYTAPDTSRINRQHRTFVAGAKEMRLSGFRTVSDGLMELPDDYGIQVAINWDSAGTMIYEAAIPFKTFFKSTLSAPDTNKVLGISFNFTVTPQHTNSGEGGGHGGGGGMRGGGMGGMGGGGMGGGGGMHGGGGGGHGGSGSAEPEKQISWAAFKLALRQ